MHSIKNGFWIGALSLLLAACGNQTPQQTAAASQPASAMAISQDMPTYLVATEASYAPFEFRDENGLVIGYDIDILTAIGKNQGFKVQFINQQWDGIFNTVNNGSRDIIAAGLGINDKRKEIVDMSEPYGKSPNIVLYTDEKLNLKSVSDLKPLKIATQSDTRAVEQLKAAGITDITTTKTLYLALKALLNNQVQAVAGDGAVLLYSLRPLSDVKYYTMNLEHAEDNKGLGFAVKKGNTELLTKINTGLANIKADGTYKQINEKWFGQVLE
ncbi:transporter substrate-binding domain-containing protein [Paralysiella testudinis]|uniref:Transporter substrate-binding domain-containing protein n=1 Tax=Paralysiella testudinis TaxID=2809020 RepID=A0A892ZL96_9NEIS|nr:transporter substrate-binding domain-containing protein [Paralysiella testudinis]QRQ81669.1 transporter substrate-binding domain-containing protein [Paralysiella testudinis]